MLRLFWPLALLACALLMAAPAAAQNAETFFHQAAQSYIGKDVPAAKRQVEAGLNIAPSDPKLLALQKKLEQQEQQQSGSSGQGQPQDQQDQNQKGQQGGEQQESEDQKEAQENEQQGDDQSPDDPQQGEQENQENPSDAQPGEAQQQPPPDPGTLTEAQAERILQALQNQEKQLLRQVQRGRPVQGRPTDKDW